MAISRAPLVALNDSELRNRRFQPAVVILALLYESAICPPPTGLAIAPATQHYCPTTYYNILQRIDLRAFLALRPLLRPQQIRGKNSNNLLGHYRIVILLDLMLTGVYTQFEKNILCFFMEIKK
jgi:hypothetical protein